MSEAVLAIYLGNTHWYTNSPCNHECPMDGFADASSIEEEDAIVASFNHNCREKHIIVGQSVGEQFGDEGETTKKVYDVFHTSNSVYVSLDGIVAGRMRARILFIYNTNPEDRSFQLNCTFNAAQTVQSIKRIREKAQTKCQFDISNITDDQLAATLFVGIIEKIANIFSRMPHLSSNNDAPRGLAIHAKPLKFTIEAQVAFPMPSAEPSLSVENHTVLHLHDAIAQINSQGPIVDPSLTHTPFSQAIEEEIAALAQPLESSVANNEPPKEKEVKDPLIDNKDGAPANEQNLSCLQLIGNFLTALLQTIGECLSSCWQKACG